MSARIRGAETELEQLNEETDEYTKTTSKLRDLVMSLTGFDIMEDENTFKDVYEIILGIGKEWQNLTDTEQASLGEALAGKRSANALYAVLGNLDTLQSAYETAENSAGSAMREQENYEKSIQYSLDRLSASVQEWSNTLVSSDVVKWFVDLANAAVELSTALTPLGTLAMGGGLFAGIKNVGIFKTIDDETTLSGQRIVGVLQARKIAQEEVNRTLQQNIAQLELDKTALTQLEQKIASGISYEEAYAQSMTRASTAAKEHAISTKGLSGTTDTFVAKQKIIQSELKATATSSKLASVGIRALSSAFNMFAGLALMWGVTKIIEGFQYLSESAERAKEKLEEIQTELSDNNSSYENNRKTLLGLKDEYESLSKKAESLGGAQNLANDEYERYQEITSQILGITPKLVTGWNDEGVAISNKNNLLQQSVDLLDEEYEKSLRNNTTKAKNKEVAAGVLVKVDEFNNSVDTKTKSDTMANMRESFLDELEKLETELGMTEHDIVEKMWIYFDPDADPNDFWSNHVDTYEELRDLISKDYDKLGDSFVDENNPIYKLFSDEVIANMIRNADEYFSEGQRILEERETLYQDYKDQLNWVAQAAKDKSGNNAYKQLSENERAFINEYINGLGYASIQTEDDFVKMTNDIDKFTKLLASNEDVSKLVENIFTPPNENETTKQYIDRVQSAITAIQKYCTDNYIDLPIKFSTIDDIKRMTKNVKTYLVDEFDDKVGGLSLEDLQIASDKLKIDPSVHLSWDKLIAKIEEYKEAQNPDKSDIPSTFKSLWNSIGTGNDDASKEAKSAKEEILKLAEAGKLTEKAFEKSSIADTFIKAGYSIAEATKKINRMVDSSKQLSSLKSSISSIQNAYQEKKDNKVASSSTLAGMEDTFGKLSSWEKYKNILGSTSSTLEECKVAQNKLATEFVYSNNFLSQLTDKNKEYYASQLKELGITNAQSIVEDTLKAKKQVLANETRALAAATSDLNGETNNASEEFLKEAEMTGLARVQLANLVAQEQIFNNQDISTSAKVDELNKLALAYFGVANAIQVSKTSAMGADSRYYTDNWIQKQWDNLTNQQTKISVDDVKVAPSSKPKSNSTDTKQEIDWLSRRLSRMQSIIDLTASKLKNLFKIDEKENNINKQIKQTIKLIKEYGHAYDVYMSKANKVAKASGKGKNKVPALSKDIINKIQSGEITKGDYKSLIKKYGKDYADKINEYIDNYDKAQDSLKNKEEQKANKRQLKKDKIQLRIDDKQANIDLMEAQKENATSASDKNKILDDELKAYKKLYKEKKKLAEKDEDETEIARLEEERKQKEKEIKIEKHQNNIDEKQSALDALEAQKENATSASEKNAIIGQELALKREICDEELAITELNGDQNEQERLKKQLLLEEKKAQLEQIANTKDEYDLKKNALSRDEAKLQQQIAENEAKGVGQSVKDYRKQISLSEERQKELRDEKEYWEAQLAEQLASGKIVADESDAAYKELKDNIALCDEGISQCTVDQINWNKAIKEMDYKNYETLLDLLDMAYKKLENLRSIREAHGKELTNDEILKQIGIDDKIINSSKSAMESAKKNLSDAFKEGEYGFTLNTDQIDKFMDYLEYMPEQIPDLMKEFGIENFNKETYKGAFDEINKFTTANDSWVQALVDAEGLSDEIGQKIINHANEYLEALKKQKDYKDRIFAIEKAQYDLEKAKNNLTKKVWDGQQWVYSADTEAVQSAQEALDNTKFDNFTSAIEDMIDVLEQFIKDFNIYDDNGNMINKPESILSKDVLGEYTIVDIDKLFADNGWDASKLYGVMSNIQYAVPNYSIPNINLPEIERNTGGIHNHYDNIELVLPNITDASTGADLAKSFVNELKNLPSYAKQYDWNR